MGVSEAQYVALMVLYEFLALRFVEKEFKGVQTQLFFVNVPQHKSAPTKQDARLLLSSFSCHPMNTDNLTQSEYIHNFQM